MDQKVEAMMGKMGVPGASATPSKTAMALDCPPIKTMLDEVRTAPDAISPASRRALNAWARWCIPAPTRHGFAADCTLLPMLSGVGTATGRVLRAHRR
jgi:hypothetical protein